MQPVSVINESCRCCHSDHTSPDGKGIDQWIVICLNNVRRTLKYVAEVSHGQMYCQISVECAVHSLGWLELLVEECQELSSAMDFLFQDGSYHNFAGLCREVEPGIGGELC